MNPISSFKFSFWNHVGKSELSCKDFPDSQLRERLLPDRSCHILNGLIQIRNMGENHLDLLNRKPGTNLRLEAGPWHAIVEKAKAGRLVGLTLSTPMTEVYRDGADLDAGFDSH